MLRLLFLFTATTISLIASAQAVGTLSGTVKDAEGTLPGATIEVQQTELATSTDANGYFIIEQIPVGEATIIVRSLGMKPITRKITIHSGQTTTLNFSMEESQLGLDEVVITGTMSSTFVSESPVKIDVVTSKALQTYLPGASSSIIEGIQMVNGVQEVVACGVCFTNSISINGLPGPYTAVLMDGAPMYGNLASVYGLNGIPTMIIDRFEVIKGPSSTLYGSEAVAGVINIITKNPEKQPILSFDFMGTSHLEAFTNLAIAPRIRKTYGYIGVNHAYIDDYEDSNGDGFGDNVSLDRVSVFTKWNINRASGKRFTLAGKYYWEDRRNGVEAFVQDRNYREIRGNDSIYGESIYTKRIETFGSYELNTNEDFKLDFSYSYHNQDSYYGSDSYNALQHIAYANFVWNKQAGKHHVVAGLTQRYQHYDDNSVATQDSVNGRIVNQPDNQYIPGVFIQDEWELAPKFTLLPGIRLDYYTAHGPIVSPRLSFKYTPGTWTTIRVNSGTGFRIVNLFTEDHAFVTGQREVKILEELKPERSYNASINLNHVFTLGKSQGMIDIDGYFTYFTNKITPNYDAANAITYANSEGHAITTGVGVSVQQEFAFPLSFNAGFNIQSVTQTEPNAEGKMETTNIEYAPQWTGVFTINYRWKKAQTTFAYTINATGPMELPEVFDLDANGDPLPNSRPTRSEPFAMQNIQITKDFKKNWALYTGIQNLWDYRQEFSPLSGFNDPRTTTGFSDTFDTAYAYSSLHGREFYLGVRWSLARGK